MPELPEVEAYRQLAEQTIGRTVSGVRAPDEWYLKGGLTPKLVRAALRGRTIEGARRIGKLLLVDLDGGSALGLRFGMTGRLVVDGVVGVDDLRYAPRRDEPAWDRFAIRFTGGGHLRMQDPRRLGGVELHTDESRLGPDARTVTLVELRRSLGTSTAPLKARLLDQSRLAGIGNLLGDEVLWRAGLDPRREAGSLTPAQVRRLHRHLVATVEDLMRRGGSHTGDLMAERGAGGHCPRDGAPLERATVGGRTTWFCPAHQH